MPRPLVAPARRAALRRRLLAWWDAGHRDLPWRFPQHAADPYRVWLSEVMLQQTRVAVVRPYYERFVEAWPTLERLAAARDEDVLAAWSGLGYYARCRNLLAAARAALARHGGLPASLAALHELPGFGPYTAGAVASIAFAIPAAAVDGNVARVLARLFAVRGAAAGAGRERIWAIARELVGERSAGSGSGGRPGDWNQALIELGATVCGPAPACGRCPVERLCAARAAGAERDIPAKRRRPAARAMELACAVIEREGRVLLFRRPAGGLFAGLLGFPATEVRPGVSARQALARALRAAGVPARAGEELGAVDRKLTHRDLRLVAFAFHPAGAVGEGEGGGEWVPWSELERAGMPTAMKALLPLAFSRRVV
ncbi:MAG TPA: NUDIX domain-containing protein [Anaeromyxobacter sp.]|nr:NUDIX domain-containing protein [Anaeromyxobacter sp.]